MLNFISISDKIQLFSIIINGIISIISITIAVSTLRQNSKMIEESTRPYIIVYGVQTNYGSPIYKIVIKNFGQSAGKIINFKTCENLNNIFANVRVPFQNLEGTIIAPGQSFIVGMSHDEYSNAISSRYNILKFDYIYKSNSNIYKESIKINIDSIIDNVPGRNTNKNNALKTISYTLQDIADNNL